MPSPGLDNQADNGDDDDTNDDPPLASFDDHPRRRPQTCARLT